MQGLSRLDVWIDGNVPASPIGHALVGVSHLCDVLAWPSGSFFVRAHSLETLKQAVRSQWTAELIPCVCTPREAISHAIESCR